MTKTELIIKLKCSELDKKDLSEKRYFLMSLRSLLDWFYEHNCGMEGITFYSAEEHSPWAIYAREYSAMKQTDGSYEAAKHLMEQKAED